MIPFKVIQMPNPQDWTAPSKYYARINTNGDININEMSELIAEISTVSRIDTKAVLEAFIMLFPRQLANGKIIRLGELGTFSISGSSEGHEKEEEVTAKSIKSVKCLFRPGKELVTALKTFQFTKKKETTSEKVQP